MKKVLIFSGIALFSVILFSLNQVFGAETVQETTLYTTTTQTQSTDEIYSIDFDGNYYYYTSYQDLINQIYEDIYNDVHNQIYDEIIDELTELYYNDIYTQVQANLEELLSQEQIELYIADFQNQLYDVISIAEKSVFGITNYILNEGTSIGSGVVYKYDSETDTYYMITNQHVIEDGERYEIRFEDETTVEATVIGYDDQVDIAVVTFSGAGLEGIVVSELGDSDLNEQTDFVLAVGNPIGYNFYNSATLGIISGVDREVDSNRYIKYIQHDAAINGGNSGGPIYNLDGEVVGINVSKFANVEVEGMGFAIPINLVKEIISRIEDNNLEEHTIMPRIGCSYYVVQDKIVEDNQVFLEKLTVNGSDKFELTIPLPTGVSSGLIINQVTPLGTLYQKLKSGDLIYKINSYTIHDEKGFQDYLYENCHSGDYITIYYYEFDQITYDYSDELSMVTLKLK